MKTRSETKPTQLYEIQGEGERINVIFNDLDSIEEVIIEDRTEYEYNHYIEEMDNNPQYIEEHKNELYEKAKQHEYNQLAEEVRAQRQTLLEATDNYAMSDRVMSDSMKTYRQELRDIPEQKGFPYEVEWPTKPQE